MLIPKVWLIIIAANSIGSPSIEKVPFDTHEQCHAPASAIRDGKPGWVDANTIIVCSVTGTYRR